jgi:hypothetical protein
MGYGKFVFGDTLELAIEAIPEEHQLRYYRYVKDYGLHGVEPELTGFELAAWVQMKNIIDITMPKQDKEISIARKNAGKKGADKRWCSTDYNDEDGMAKIANEKNDSKNGKTENDMAKIANEKNDSKTVMEMVNVNLNGNVNLKEKEAEQSSARLPPEKKSQKFVKPSAKEVADYCELRGNNIDGETFVAFYESKGWVIGKSPMKDWQASVRTWEKANKFLYDHKIGNDKIEGDGWKKVFKNSETAFPENPPGG